MTALTDRYTGTLALQKVAAATSTLLVSEIFGPTFQGEGPSAGRRSIFLRLGGCNLTCHGCDTPYTWRWSAALPHDTDVLYDPKVELQRLTFLDIADQIIAIAGVRLDTLLVVTGGEPMLQAAKLTNFLSYLRTRIHLRTEIETNGTRPPTTGLLSLIDQWNVSPKLSHWGNDPAKAFKPAVLQEIRRLARRCIFKFVCNSGDDVVEADMLRREADLPITSCWIMPEGLTQLEVMLRGEAVRDQALALGFNLTTRLQILLYGARRGV